MLQSPNNILAVEYCKAIIRQSSPMKPLPIAREGSYHAEEADLEHPSATALRLRLEKGLDISAYLPEAAGRVFAAAPIHTLAAGQRAVLGKLRTMTEAEFEVLPFGSEGLWRKLMGESRTQADLDAVASAVKSKRYTRSRIDRMILCAFLGITAEIMNMDIPYVRVLGFSNRGREILNGAKKSGFFVNAGQPVIHPLWELEQKWDDLYGLFQEGTPGRPGGAKNNRVIYLP